MKTLKSGLSLLKQSASEWSYDNATTHGAALAYYTAFSIAPLLIITIGIAGLVFGAQASQGEIFNTLQGLIGPTGAQGIQSMVQSAAQKPNAGTLATILGVVALLAGASGVFTQLQTSLNMMWKVQAKPGAGVWHLVRQRFLSFSMILVIAFLLLVSLVISAALGALGKFVGSRMPGGEALWHAVNFVVSLGVVTFLFASIYKILPDVKLEWRDVWTGALATSLLFTIGKFLIGLYLGKSSVASSYGAAGSLVIVMLWVYYSSCLLFFGAEFTKVYATRNGHRIQPRYGAELVTQQVNKDQIRPQPRKAA